MASQLQLAFGEAVRARRDELGMTQAALARALKTTQSTISDVENGCNAPTLETVERFAKVLKTTAAKLIDS